MLGSGDAVTFLATRGRLCITVETRLPTPPVPPGGGSSHTVTVFLGTLNPGRPYLAVPSGLSWAQERTFPWKDSSTACHGIAVSDLEGSCLSSLIVIKHRQKTP